MTIRLTEISDLSTQDLLGRILQVINTGERVAFHCSAGYGGAVIQRVRVALSRVRAQMEKNGKPIARFNIRHSVHHETVDGKRMDCVVAWKEQSERHKMTETLEDMLEKRA